MTHTVRCGSLHMVVTADTPRLAALAVLDDWRIHKFHLLAKILTVKQDEVYFFWTSTLLKEFKNSKLRIVI